MTTLRLAALDLALTNTGVAWTSTVAPTDGWPIGVRTIRDHGLTDHERLNHILTGLALANVDKAQVVVIERPFNNPRSPAQNLGLAGLSWLVRHWLWNADTPYVLVSAKTRAKYATDDGGADKPTVMRMARARFGAAVAAISDDNEADALTLLAMALHAYGAPLTPPTRQQDDAVRAVRWPRLRVPAKEATWR